MICIGLPALAHAQLIDAYPKANQLLNASPTQFKLNFSDILIDLGPSSNWLKVEDSAGELVSSEASLRGSELTASPIKSLQPGKYQLSWRVLSEDGHPIQGSYVFTITGQELKLTARSLSQKTLTLSFSEKLAAGSKVTVIGPGSKNLKGVLRLREKQAVFSFSAKPAAGRYQVYYLAKSDSGLSIRGSFTITQR
jgi:methionine-rich copper-binding protein CopC